MEKTRPIGPGLDPEGQVSRKRAGEITRPHRWDQRALPGIAPRSPLTAQLPTQSSSVTQGSWETRYARLASRVGLDPEDPVLVALSGGADSVLLLELAHRARPRPSICAVHVDHGLRGEESDGDAVFCARLCAARGIPYVRRRVHLDPDPSGLESRARTARYAALAEEAERRLRAHGTPRR